MKKTTLFFILVVFIVAGAIGVSSVAISWFKKKKQETVTWKSSDAHEIEHTIRVAGDSWVGYTVFRSPYFTRFLGEEKIGIEFSDDHGNYPERMKKFSEGSYDIILSTLDTYLSNARAVDYPGVIIFVVDESKGGDGIVATQEITSLPELARPGVKIALTPNSPSDFLLQAITSHFDLEPLKVRGSWLKETEGSKKAFKVLRSGSVQAAVLWEPELTEAVSDKRFHKLLGTEKTEGLIVDLCIARREFVVEKPELVEAFMRSYFRALRFYQSDEKALLDQVKQDASTSSKKAKVMLEGVSFPNLTQNAHTWFGVGPPGVTQERLLTSFKANIEILIETKRLPSDPLNGAYRKTINSAFLETLYQTGLQGKSATSSVFKTEKTPASKTATAPSFVFPKLDEEGWKKLKVVGKLKIRPILFQSGTDLLALDGKRSIDRIQEDLAHYPRFRLLVQGHTKPEGDEEQNLILSKKRAESVAHYLKRVHDMSENRIRVEGVGGKQPLPQTENESIRRWKGRQPRVEIYLVEDPTLE